MKRKSYAVEAFLIWSTSMQHRTKRAHVPGEIHAQQCNARYPGDGIQSGSIEHRLSSFLKGYSLCLRIRINYTDIGIGSLCK